MPAVEYLTGNRLVAVVQRRLLEIHLACEAPEDLCRWQAFAGWRRCRLVPGYVQVAIRNQQILMFDLHGRRQHDISVTSGVSEKVLDDNREEIVARQAAQHLRLVWNARCRITGVYEQHLDRRLVDLEQPFAKSRHVQRPRWSRSEIVAPHGAPVDAEEAAGVVADAAARIAPIASDAWDAGERPDGHSATAVALKTDADANAGR